MDTESMFLKVLAYVLLSQWSDTNALGGVEQSPQNLVVKAGEEIRMSCRTATSTSIDWYHTSAGNKTTQKINHNNKIINPLFENATLNGGLPGQRLIIKSANEQHAGIYKCSPSITLLNGSLTFRDTSAHVVVLTQDPICQLKPSEPFIEGQTLVMTCVTPFAGSLTPTMKWTQVTSTGAKEISSSNSITATHVKSSLTILADISIHKSVFRCTTSFEIANDMKYPIQRMALNRPNYTHVWPSPIILLNYGPHDIRIRTNMSNETLSYDDQLVCEADGNPIPQIYWINEQTGKSSAAAVLSVGEELTQEEPHDIVFTCWAKNLVTNRTLNISTRITVGKRTLPIHGSSSQSQDQPKMDRLPGILATVLAVSLIVVACLSVYIARNRNKKRQKAIKNEMMGNMANSENPKIPFRRATQLSLPIPDAGDYISPSEISSQPSFDYNEIPDALPNGYQNEAYFAEIGSEPRSPRPLPFPAARYDNEYLKMADVDPMANHCAYETIP